jgi:hypothetical protein
VFQPPARWHAALSLALLATSCATAGVTNVVPGSHATVVSCINPPEQEAVRMLIGRLSHPEVCEAQFAFDTLQIMAPDVRRTLVCEMDNRTPIRAGPFRVFNRGPQAFEAWALYGPKQVVDVLAIVLGNPPGSKACWLHNGGTAEQRLACIHAWQEAEHLAPRPEQPGTSLTERPGT